MDDAKDLKEYELAFLVRDEGSAEEVAAKAAQYGTVASRGALKRLSFAYPVAKESSGYFGYLCLDAAPERAAQLEKDFRLLPVMLRFLLLRLPVRTPQEQAAGGVPAVPPRPRRAPRAARAEERLAAAGPLTNEALEKKIEEILQ
jgi:ribosomal protein S6